MGISNATAEAFVRSKPYKGWLADDKEACCIQTLTPLQHARCMVAALPFLPDVMYVCSVVYLQDRGLPLGHLDLLPDMESLRSDISVHGWDLRAHQWSAYGAACKLAQYRLHALADLRLVRAFAVSGRRELERS